MEDKLKKVPSTIKNEHNYMYKVVISVWMLVCFYVRSKLRNPLNELPKYYDRGNSVEPREYSLFWFKREVV